MVGHVSPDIDFKNCRATFPSPDVAGRLNAATAISPCDVWAVGQRYVTGVATLTLNEHFTCN